MLAIPSAVFVLIFQESVGTIEEGFQRARNDEYIFFYGGAIVTFEANSKPCNLQIIGEQLFSFGWVNLREGQREAINI